MMHAITGKDCFYGIKKNDITLGFYEQTTRKRAFQGALRLMGKIVSYNDKLEEGIKNRFPTCNGSTRSQQDREAFEGIEGLFLFALIEFYICEDYDQPTFKFYTYLEKENNYYTLIQDRNLHIDQDYLYEEKIRFINQFKDYTESLQSRWQKFIIEVDIEKYLATYDDQINDALERNLPRFTHWYGTRREFQEGTKNLYAFFKEFFAQDQETIDSDVNLINKMVERYVFFGLYDYVYTQEEVEEAKKNRDGWQEVMDLLVELQANFSEDMSSMELKQKVKKIMSDYLE